MAEERNTKSKCDQTISRREFLKDAGLIVGGTAIGSMPLMNGCGGTTTTTATIAGTTSKVTKTVTETGTAPVTAQDKIALTVNGRKYEFQVAPNETIQDLLRKKIGLTSPKDMCFGYGACGSCSIIMDGRPVLSCMVLAIECNEAVIETSEGIAAANHPLIEAYIMNNCAQCGYCTPGFLVTSKALLDHNPNPTEEDIKEALAGNICRCGTYPQHIKAILEAST